MMFDIYMKYPIHILDELQIKNLFIAPVEYRIKK